MQNVYWSFNSFRPHSLVVLVSGHTASGTYKCEVSVEKSFYTLSNTKNVTVVGKEMPLLWSCKVFIKLLVPPLNAPTISGGREYYNEVSQLRGLNFICWLLKYWFHSRVRVRLDTENHFYCSSRTDIKVSQMWTQHEIPFRHFILYLISCHCSSQLCIFYHQQKTFDH